MNQIKKIVLTGGPCAGKTTALVKVTEYFTNLGYKVFTVPEVPTMITQSGWNYLTTNKHFYYEGELVILQLQLTLEDSIQRIAETVATEQPCVIICDRGTMDISAYISTDMWEELAHSVGYTLDELRDRYDAVLHLVTAADGAEQFYTTATNAQRYEKADAEGLKIARALDKAVLHAWSGHAHLRVIDNHSSAFQMKLDRVLNEISNVLEIPRPNKDERKFVVELTDQLPLSIEQDIVQTYLTAEPNCEVRLRRRTVNGQSINIHTTTKTLANAQVTVTERQVNNSLYETLLQQKDPYRKTIHKTRRSFIWQGQFFEIDTYQDLKYSASDNVPTPLIILETKGFAPHEEINFPPFIRVLEDITGNKAFYNYNLALQ